ncbi:MAK10-like protein [Tanacetum coccineum]
MGDENPIYTLGDYSKPSHKGYRNTIDLPIGNNVSEDPNQHLKDFLKLVDSLDLDGSITTWEDLTTRFLAQFFPPRRTAKLRNDILMFQQHHGESLSKAWTRFKRTIDQSAGGKLRDLNAEESWALLEDLALYDNESWNDSKDFAKPVKVIALPQDVPMVPTTLSIAWKIPEQAFVEYASSRTDEAGGKWYTFKPEQNNLGDTYNSSWNSHPNLRWRQPQNSQNNFLNPPNRFQPNGSILNRSFNNRPQNFSSQSNLEGQVSNLMASQDAGLSMFEADFKQQQSEMTNKINTVLKTITDRIAGTLPSDTGKNPKLSTPPVLSAHSYPTIDLQCSAQIHNSINAITIHLKQQGNSRDDETEENKEERKDNPGNIHSNTSTPPDPSVSFITEKVLKFNSLFEPLGLVPRRPTRNLFTPKREMAK